MSHPPEERRRSAASDSPCVAVCRMHANGSYCLGCLRTIEEIGAWGSYSASERDVVLRELAARRARLRKQRRKSMAAMGHAVGQSDEGSSP